MWRQQLPLGCMFSRRTNWDLSKNRYTAAVESHSQSGRAMLDLTASNPTIVGLRFEEQRILRAFSDPRGLIYDPASKGMLSSRTAVAEYYAETGTSVSPNSLILTVSTSEAYSYCFRLLCEPGDEVLVPQPSYPLFDFLAGLQDVKLVPYELIYDHGWQIDFHSLEKAITRDTRAVLVVHPNNPTGSYVKSAEMNLLNKICADRELAIIADEVFLDYKLGKKESRSFAENQGALTFTLSGLSKISGLPQMKAAWLAVSGPETQALEALSRLEVIADTYLSVNTPVQLALPAMLDSRKSFQRQLLKRILENLEELDRELGKQALCQRLDVEGGWYAILRVPVTRSDEELAIDLLLEEDVLVQPGHFYDFVAEGYLVISLITRPVEFAEGIRRIISFVQAICV